MSQDTYEDILDHPHHESKKHPRMSMLNRAAQFSPFAALSGYEEAVAETERLTDERIILDEAELEMLDAQFCALKDSAGRKEASITYFIPDERKEGGRYETVKGLVRRIDENKKLIIMEDQTVIPAEEVVKIEV